MLKIFYRYIIGFEVLDKAKSRLGTGNGEYSLSFIINSFETLKQAEKVILSVNPRIGADAIVITGYTYLGWKIKNVKKEGKNEKEQQSN